MTLDRGSRGEGEGAQIQATQIQREAVPLPSQDLQAISAAMGRRHWTEARKVVRHFFTRLSTALVTLLPSFDSNFSGRLSNPKQCFQVSLSTS